MIEATPIKMQGSRIGREYGSNGQHTLVEFLKKEGSLWEIKLC